MPRTVVKPSFWKTFLMWLLIVLIIMVVVTIVERPDLTDPLAWLLLAVFVVVRSSIMALIFFLIPYFRVEVDDTHVTGPGSPLGPGWNRVKIPLTEFEERNVKPGIGWLGFHRITSRSSGTITVWWFGPKQTRFLLDAIARRQQSGAPLGAANAG